MLENSDDHKDNYKTDHSIVLESNTEKPTSDALRQNEKDGKEELVQLHKENEDTVRRSHERCVFLSNKLLKKNQNALYKFNKLTSPSKEERSKAIQYIIDTKLATEASIETICRR